MSSQQSHGPRVITLALLLFSTCAFAAAIVTPLFRIEPRAEEWTEALKLIAPEEMQSREFNLLGGIASMWQGGERLLAIIVTLFSLILPLAKLSLLTVESASPESLSNRWRQLMISVSRYAMVEVFVIALLVMLAKGMPGGSRMELGTGAYAFVVSVLTALAAEHNERRFRIVITLPFSV